MPDPAKDRVVSVEVVLHPPGGGRADDASVTAEHIASLTVPAETMQRVQGWFTAHGLETGPSGPISFSVTGPAAALAEALRLKPEFNSVACLRATYSSMSNPQLVVILDKTAGVGLRRAGLPDE